MIQVFITSTGPWMGHIQVCSMYNALLLIVEFAYKETSVEKKHASYKIAKMLHFTNC